MRQPWLQTQVFPADWEERCKAWDPTLHLEYRPGLGRGYFGFSIEVAINRLSDDRRRLLGLKSYIKIILLDRNGVVVKPVHDLNEMVKRVLASEDTQAFKGTRYRRNGQPTYTELVAVKSVGV